MKFTRGIVFLVSSTLVAAVPVEPGGILFENSSVKVIRALEKAHLKGKVHDHKTNRVMVYLQAGEQHFSYQDGRKAETLHWTPGQAVWTPAGGTHQPEVTGDESFNIIEVELKKSGNGTKIESDLDPVQADPGHYRVEFENNQVRVVRVNIGAHETAPLHEHPYNRVAIYLTDQQFNVSMADGKVQPSQHKAGEAVWAPSVIHREENVSDKPYEALLVEIK